MHAWKTEYIKVVLLLRRNDFSIGMIMRASQRIGEKSEAVGEAQEAR